jgi:hypothetical protein
MFGSDAEKHSDRAAVPATNDSAMIDAVKKTLVEIMPPSCLSPIENSEKLVSAHILWPTGNRDGAIRYPVALIAPQHAIATVAFLIE